MSEKEFEAYLSLLARFLKLTPAQRENIAQELRDHLEQRLEELAAKGYSHEEAVQAALEEFGDAAGLADELSHIIHARRRRRIMQTSIGTIAAAAAIILVFTYLLPEHRPGTPSPGYVQAEQTEDQAPAAVERHARTAVVTTGPDPIMAKLEKRIDVDFDGNKLVDVIEHLRGATGVNFFVNWRALYWVERVLPDGESEHVSPDSVVSLELEDTPAKLVLSLVLESLGDEVEYYTQDGVVIISTQASMPSRELARVYVVRDLLTAPEDATQLGYRERALIQTINAGSLGLPEDSVQINSMFAIYDHLLVVRAEPSEQEEIQQVLDMLREAREQVEHEAARDREATRRAMPGMMQPGTMAPELVDPRFVAPGSVEPEQADPTRGRFGRPGSAGHE